jgi:group I intron endonuclease
MISPFQDEYIISSFSMILATRSQRSDKYLKNIHVQPKAVFENLDNEITKITISNFIKPLAGVYLIINLVNGNKYVGSAITGRMRIRFYKHLYSLQGSKRVAAAVLEYGLNNFAFVCLDTMPGVVTSEDNKTLLEMENYYIKLLQPEYNIAQQANNTFGVTHTEATKIKMQINYTSERREFIGSLNRGKNLSPETIERIRAAAKVRPPMNSNTRHKISINSIIANYYTINRIDNAVLPDGSYSIILRTIPIVAKYCFCSNKTVQRALSGTGIIKKT